MRKVGDSLPGTHQEQADKGAQAVPKRPLVFALEDTRLQQLQDAQHMQEEGQVVLLPELLEVQMCAAVQEGCDHGQVPGGQQKDAPGHTFPQSPRPHTVSAAVTAPTSAAGWGGPQPASGRPCWHQPLCSQKTWSRWCLPGA